MHADRAKRSQRSAGRELFRRLLPLALFAVLSHAGGGFAQSGRSLEPADWPGLWGPDRTARVAGPLQILPTVQLKEVWRRPIGKGFSEVAVAGGRGYTMFSEADVDYLGAFDVATGKETWRRRLEATYHGHDGSLDGPISTPVLAGGRLFALTPWGKLFAVEQATGREVWRLDLKADLGAAAPFWGFATSPLPLGGILVVQAGGATSNSLVALDPASGKLVWSAHPASGTGYSSPVAMTLQGVPQIVAATQDKVFAVRPVDGAVLWSAPSLGETRQSPVSLPGDRVLLTNWYETAVLQVKSDGGAWGVRELWRKPVFKTTYSPAVYRQGYLYGMNGNFLTCLDVETGETKWREKIYNAALLLAGGYLAALGEQSGDFRLVEASPEGFRQRLKARIFTPGALSMTGPMFVSGRFLLRNGEEMVLLELAPAETAAGAARNGS